MPVQAPPRTDKETTSEPMLLDPVEIDTLRQLRAMVNLLDDRFTIPGTNFRTGLDGIIGFFIPVVGDVITTGLSLYLIHLARRMNVPKHVIARMMWNVGVDATVGIVPFVGDVADIAWKANLKNLRLLERHLQKRATRHASIK